MASVSSVPRARRAIPTVAEVPANRLPADDLPEGWEPGGRHPSRQATAPAKAPSPRSGGTCRLTLRINGVDYRLRPMPAPAGLSIVWTLSKIQPDPLTAPVAYAVAADGQAEVHCTCPDHQHNGHACKHILALAACHLIPPVVSPPAPSPSPVVLPASDDHPARHPARPTRRTQPGKARPKKLPAKGACSGCGETISRDESYRADVLICGDCYCSQEGGQA